MSEYLVFINVHLGIFWEVEEVELDEEEINETEKTFTFCHPTKIKKVLDIEMDKISKIIYSKLNYRVKEIILSSYFGNFLNIDWSDKDDPVKFRVEKKDEFKSLFNMEMPKDPAEMHKNLESFIPEFSKNITHNILERYINLSISTHLDFIFVDLDDY